MCQYDCQYDFITYTLSYTWTFKGVPIKPSQMETWYPLGTIWHPFEGAGVDGWKMTFPFWIANFQGSSGSEKPSTQVRITFKEAIGVEGRGSAA